MIAQQKIPRASHWSQTPIAGLFNPMLNFINNTSSLGIVLLLSTVLALFFANTSSLAPIYDEVLHTYVAIGVPDTALYLKMSALHWINDGLMVIFFLLVGLEIKREMKVGELTNLRAAALPIIAAIGGVVVPALIYTFFNAGLPSQGGWGIPMATDIAFVIGCLALLGDRVPLSLKVFLTAVAIVDDLMAVLVIALFYSGGLNYVALLIGFEVLALLMLANFSGVRALSVYLILGLILWVAFLQSGIHATIAGVLLAFTIPARNRIDEDRFLKQARHLLDEFEEGEFAPTPMMTDEHQQHIVIELEDACEQVQAPLQKLEHSLHKPVNFLIMPIFAFANAGVAISLDGIGGANTVIALGVAFGLLLGKPIGVFGASWLAVRSGIASLPSGVNWKQMLGAGLMAGIGFTMSLFIASLAFGEGSPMLDGAKLAILFASLIAGVVGLAILALTSPSSQQAQNTQALPAHGD
ncbi:MAG: Na+/H+ antiporter NhaA [Ardenticatenaceae bacterium]